MLMWRKDGHMFGLNGQILTRNQRMSLTNIENGNILYISNASKSDEGIYSCQVLFGSFFLLVSLQKKFVLGQHN